MADSLAVGMIGAGGIARSHMRSIGQLDEVRLAGVMDVDAGRAQSAADEYGGRAHTSLEDILADDEIEAVHVCTPHSLHVGQVVAAAEAGKHVLVEARMAMNSMEALAMLETSKAKPHFGNGTTTRL